MGIDLQAAEGERDAAGNRVSPIRRPVEGVCPVGFFRRDPLGAAPVQLVDPTATATADPGTGQGVGNIQGTIDDMIVAVETGEIQYLVVDVTLDEGQRWIPVPLTLIQWDAANGAFSINANPATFRDAPSFENGQYPDTSMSGWNAEFDTFWQNNGGTGTGAGSADQATPTP